MTSARARSPRRTIEILAGVVENYWDRLDARTRDAVGALLPGFAMRFLAGRDWASYSRPLLGAAGVETAIADAVLAEIAAMTFAPSDHPLARNLVRLLERTGILAHPEIHAALRRDGWIAATSPPEPTERA